jgi:beta-glucosidase
MTLNPNRSLIVLLPILALAGCVMPPKPYKKPPTTPVVKTGAFWWGTSTASFQNEDRGLDSSSPWYFKTDWDIFAEEGHIPPRGDEATFSWTHFDKDLSALKKLV